MKTPRKKQSPLLHRLYRRYLLEEDTAAFIKSVSQSYTWGTLARLADQGGRISRRSAVLALGLVADYDVNAVLGRALQDEDRGVRMLAEDSIRQIWLRCGNDSQRQRLRIVARLNASCRHEEAVEQVERLIDDGPELPEPWNQRAIAYYQLGRYRDAIDDCHQALELNPYHFAAAARMGQAFLEIGDPGEALLSFRRALRLNPAMEGIRSQVARLARRLKEK